MTADQDDEPGFSTFPLMTISPPAFLRMVALGVLLTGAAGCVNLSPHESQTQYYVLGAEADTRTSLDLPSAAGLSIALRPVRLASYLDSPALVTRLGPNQVQFAEFNRWGEDLRRAINRTVSGYIGAQLPVQRIDVVPLPSGARYDYVIQLRVLRFEGDAAAASPAPSEAAVRTGVVRMLTTWEVIDPASGVVLRRGTTDHEADGWPVGDYGALVNHLDTALERLARDLVDGLQELHAGR